MSAIELTLSESMMERLQDEAYRRKLPLSDIVNMALEHYFEDKEETNEEILADLRQGMLDALTGNARPAYDVLDEIEATDDNTNH